MAMPPAGPWRPQYAAGECRHLLPTVRPPVLAQSWPAGDGPAAARGRVASRRAIEPKVLDQTPRGQAHLRRPRLDGQRLQRLGRLLRQLMQRLALMRAVVEDQVGDAA